MVPVLHASRAPGRPGLRSPRDGARTSETLPVRAGKPLPRLNALLLLWEAFSWQAEHPPFEPLSEQWKETVSACLLSSQELFLRACSPFHNIRYGVQFRADFPHFQEVVLAGLESFAQGQEENLLKLTSEQAEAWLDLIEETGRTPEGLGVAGHFLYIGQK